MHNNFGREQPERPRARLVRGPDGRLRATDRADIGDVWAEQKRIRLAEAIQEDQKRIEKKKRRESGQKEFVVNIGLPKFSLPKLKLVKLPSLKSKKPLIAGLAVLFVVGGLGAAAYAFFNRDSEADEGAGVLTAEDLRDQKPDYDTVLPKGKAIEDLGGWARVSPPDKEPVFAYVDRVEGVQLNVSQQLLPESFKQDVDKSITSVAEQFGASKRLNAGDGLTIYLGVSAQGPQSAIFTKNGLLILIKSASELTDGQWMRYAQNLQ